MITDTVTIRLEDMEYDGLGNMDFKFFRKRGTSIRMKVLLDGDIDQSVKRNISRSRKHYVICEDGQLPSEGELLSLEVNIWPSYTEDKHKWMTVVSITSDTMHAVLAKFRNRVTISVEVMDQINTSRIY